MKLLIVQFSSSSRHFISFRSKFLAAPCSQTPSVYVSPLMSQTKFHTHTEQQAKVNSQYFPK
jgi:hypothetical protein